MNDVDMMYCCILIINCVGLVFMMFVSLFPLVRQSFICLLLHCTYWAQSSDARLTL